ncbi:MAG: response regulator [Verrucomicrobiia bacterium]|jgi:DNA-binding response OmpR family regulator
MTSTGNHPPVGQLQGVGQAESPVTTGKPKILIVEDDTAVAMMMVHVLSRAGCDVLVANTGQKGMELAQENRFDLIALDTDLPDINGLEICSELKQRHLSRHASIVLISKRPCAKDRQRALKLGAVDYIIKPFDAADFVSRILAHSKPPRTENNYVC